MKLLTTLATTLLVSVLFASTMVSAQPDAAPPCGGRCLGRQGGPYDPRTVETLSGEVLSVDRMTGPKGGAGVHIALKTDKGEPLAVHLGPAWYLDKQSVTVRQGDKLTVRGSRVSFDC